MGTRLRWLPGLHLGACGAVEEWLLRLRWLPGLYLGACGGVRDVSAVGASRVVNWLLVDEAVLNTTALKVQGNHIITFV